jgi:hypothetical protein
MLAELAPALELHQQVLADLDRRDAAIVEREAEARRVLEQALADCAAEHTRIDQEKQLLTQASQLYRRFLENKQQQMPASPSIASPEPEPPPPVREAQPWAPAPQQEPQVEQLALVDSATESQIADTIRDIRNQLITDRRGMRAG